MTKTDYICLSVIVLTIVSLWFNGFVIEYTANYCKEFCMVDDKGNIPCGNCYADCIDG